MIKARGLRNKTPTYILSWSPPAAAAKPKPQGLTVNHNSSEAATKLPPLQRSEHLARMQQDQTQTLTVKLHNPATLSRNCWLSALPQRKVKRQSASPSFYIMVTSGKRITKGQEVSQ